MLLLLHNCKQQCCNVILNNYDKGGNFTEEEYDQLSWKCHKVCEDHFMGMQFCDATVIFISMKMTSE